jgi:hypothetical protein
MTRIASALDTLERYEHRLIDDVFAEYGTRIALGAYAFVFGYYGFLKLQAPVTGLSTPVRGEVGHLVEILGLPEVGIGLTAVMLFVGLYETSLGALFALGRLRLALPAFLCHQAVTFASLVVARGYYFQEPYVLGVPWLFDAFAAYILKNTIFVGAFLVLAVVELGDRDPEPATGRSDRSSPAAGATD